MNLLNPKSPNLCRRAFSALLGATLTLQSCGQDPTAGTSSETQTALQMLADNSRWMADGGAKSPGAAPNLAARTLDSNPFADSSFCSETSGTSYEKPGKVYRAWKGVATDLDGNPVCTGPRVRYATNELFVDSTGYLSREGIGIDEITFEGSGYWILPSGLRLELDRIFFGVIDNEWRFQEEIRFASTCRIIIDQPVKWNIDSTTNPVGPINAPIQCSGVRAGTFRWSPNKQPEILDLDGNTLKPRGLATKPSPYDSLGLALIQHSYDSVSQILSGKFRIRLLPGDTLPVGAQVTLHANSQWQGSLDTDGSFQIQTWGITSQAYLEVYTNTINAYTQVFRP